MTRTAWLLAAIQREGGTWTTQRAELLLADCPVSCHRNSARRSLRSLVRSGHLAPVDGADGRRTYTPTTTSTERTAA